MNTFGNRLANHPAAVQSLAVVGFVALVTLGMALAVYSTRFVPPVVDSVGAAAVYLGSVFTRAPASLSVVPTATSTIISFGDASSTPATSTTPALPQAPKKPVTPVAGAETAAAHPIGGTAPAAPSGLPDLKVTINKVGYLATSSATSFVTSATVPAGSRPAVNFTIKNVGGNVTGAWRWSASIPTLTAYVYQSDPQQSLAPGDSIEYTLGFDQALKGADKVITITANSDHAISESTTANNVASTSVTVLGS